MPDVTAGLNRLTGKNALVTGAAQGIGLAIARAFLNEGARVTLTDISDDRGDAEAKTLGEFARYRRLDVREELSWIAALDEASADRPIDIVVNNAGITGFGDDFAERHDPEHADLAAWRAVLATNLDGVFLGCKHAIRSMRETETAAGSIINIGSRSGVVGTPAAAAYAASKAAVRNHTKSVALYCAEQGLPIRCNVIQPAAILTQMWEPMLGDGPARQDRMDALTADCPLRRFGTPEEVAALAVHLASDESLYTTGAEFTIDGGMLAGTAQRPTPAGGG